jgi:chemotaxis protein histidine kinase CheA
MAEKDNAKDLVNAVEKIAAGKAAKENQSLALELEKTFSSLASVQQKLANENAETKKIIEEGAAAELKANQEQQQLLKDLLEISDNSKDTDALTKELDELNLNMRITAEKAEATAQWQQSSAGQAVALKKELESQGKIAEENKEFQKLSYQARKEDYAQRLKDATSPAAKKEIREEARADAKKNGSRLDKIGAGIAGMWASSKKVLIGGAKALLSTLAIGGLLIALGLFLQSDTFKKLSEYISGTIIPKAKELSDAFFGEKGGIGAGFSKLAEIFAPEGSFLIRLGLLTAKWTGKAAIMLILSPLTLAFKAVKGIFSLLAESLELISAPAKATAAAAKAAAAKAAAAAAKAAGIKAAAAFNAAATERVTQKLLAKKLAAAAKQQQQQHRV